MNIYIYINITSLEKGPNNIHVRTYMYVFLMNNNYKSDLWKLSANFPKYIYVCGREFDLGSTGPTG